MEKSEEQFADLQSRLQALEGKVQSNKLSMIVSRGDMDKVLASLVIANIAKIK